MNITPKAGPLVLDPARPAGQGQKDADRRARSMAALMGSGPPVANPSNTSPIEHVSMQQAAVTTQDREQASGQSNHVETPSSEAVVEPKVETAAPTSKPEESPLSQHYAILARKEKALRAKVAAQEQSLREKEAAIKAQEDALKARDLEYQSKYISRDRFSEDPLSAINDAGLSYEKLTELMLNPQQAQENLELRRYQAKIEAEIKSLREGQEKSIKAQEEATTRQYQQALTQIHHDVKAAIATDPAYETIQATGSSKDVVDLIERTYKKQGVLLSVEEACNEVESYLMEEAEKIFKISKLSKKFQQAASAPAPVAKPGQLKEQPQGMKTLTNAVTSSRKLSSRDRAVLKFQGKLN